MVMARGTGGFVFVVGPSGAGKDSLIAGARAQLAGEKMFVFPRRTVTRQSSAHEDHDTLDEAAFARAEKEGRFALSWRAHGLGYGIPRAARSEVEAGCIVICNVSRRIVPWSRLHLPNVLVVEVTAPLEILAERLKARGRVEDGDIAARLARAQQVWTPVDHSIVNDRSVEDGASALIALIRAHAGNLASGHGPADRATSSNP